MKHEAMAQKIKRLRQRIDRLTARIDADIAARKQLQKEMEALEAAQIMEIMRSASDGNPDIAVEFAAYLRERRKHAVAQTNS